MTTLPMITIDMHVVITQIKKDKAIMNKRLDQKTEIKIVGTYTNPINNEEFEVIENTMMSKFKTTWSVKSVKYKTSCEFDLIVLDQELYSFELVQTGGVIHRNKQHEVNDRTPKKLMSHDLARILLKKANSVVMVNCDFDA